MAFLLDLSKERDAHINQRLQQNSVVWFNSVRPDGRPHAVIVWFIWDGETILVFSRPNNQKVRNIQQNQHVVIAMDDSHQGSDPITIEGTAQLLSPGEVDVTLAAYVEKYSEGMKYLNLTPQQMAAQYSQGIRITLTRVS